MPIIISLVPNSAEKEICDQVRVDIKAALQKEGVPKNQITVEFIACVFPERLVVDYRSRSEHLRKEFQSDREAKIVGKIIEKHFKLPVECLITILKRKNTGIYLTPIVSDTAKDMIECKVCGSIKHMQSRTGRCTGCGK